MLFRHFIRGARTGASLACWVTLLGLLAGCSTTGRSGPTGPSAPPPPIERRPEPVAQQSADVAASGEVNSPTGRASPQATAAAALIRQARKMIDARRWDAALTRLERAASINPRDGAGHYWLAEVWRAKGDADQALEHHRLAKRYLAGRADWASRLARQADKLE